MNTIQTSDEHEQEASLGIRGGTRAQPALISVVLPVLNGEAHIESQLAALASQRYVKPWELVVVDNGCTDRTIQLVESWRGRLPELVVIRSEKRGINSARGVGVATARGDFVAFCDADDVVAPGWLQGLAEAAVEADLVGGDIDVEELNDGLQLAWQGGTPPPRTGLNRGPYRFLPYLSGGNCGIWTEVARALGFDESFGYGASDVEFSWRAQLAGLRLAYEPRVVLRIRYRDGMLGLAKQWFRYGAAEPQLFRRFRDRGMPRPRILDTLKPWAWLIVRLPKALRSREATGNWLRVAARSMGRMWGSLRWRVLYL